MKYDVVIFLYAYRVQDFCKRRGLYTYGNNQQFEELLQSIRMNSICTPDRVVAICENIVAHSDPDCEWMQQAMEHGLDDQETAKAMAGILISQTADIRVTEVR